jgi:glycosyltransferase involved in cell wall biosynthesis
LNDKQFSRGGAINTGLLKSTRPYVCAYDTDILVDPEALRSGVSLIKSGKWPIVIPFNLIFVELSGELRKRLISELDITGLSRITHLSDVPKHPEISSRVLSGAIMLCDKEIAINEGGYNRKMISYGWEDIEFFKRFAKLGYYSFMLTDFNLIHLDHRRGPDSRVNEMYAINKMEFDKVTGMSVPELKDYVERELCIAPGVDPDLRRRLRRKRELINWITARRPLHLMNRISNLRRIKGSAALFRMMFRVREPV